MYGNAKKGEAEEAGQKSAKSTQQALCCRLPGQAFQPELGYFEMDDVEQRQIRDQSRQCRMFDQVEITDAGEFGDQEGRRAHHRWCQLAICR